MLQSDYIRAFTITHAVNPPSNRPKPRYRNASILSGRDCFKSQHSNASCVYVTCRYFPGHSNGVNGASRNVRIVHSWSQHSLYATHTLIDSGAIQNADRMNAYACRSLLRRYALSLRGLGFPENSTYFRRCGNAGESPVHNANGSRSVRMVNAKNQCNAMCWIRETRAFSN